MIPERMHSYRERKGKDARDMLVAFEPPSIFLPDALEERVQTACCMPRSEGTGTVLLKTNTPVASLQN